MDLASSCGGRQTSFQPSLRITIVFSSFLWRVGSISASAAYRRLSGEMGHVVLQPGHMSTSPGKQGK